MGQVREERCTGMYYSMMRSFVTDSEVIAV